MKGTPKSKPRTETKERKKKKKPNGRRGPGDSFLTPAAPVPPAPPRDGFLGRATRIPPRETALHSEAPGRPQTKEEKHPRNVWNRQLEKAPWSRALPAGPGPAGGRGQPRPALCGWRRPARPGGGAAEAPGLRCGHARRSPRSGAAGRGAKAPGAAPAPAPGERGAGRPGALTAAAPGPPRPPRRRAAPEASRRQRAARAGRELRLAARCERPRPAPRGPRRRRMMQGPARVAPIAGGGSAAGPAPRP